MQKVREFLSSFVWLALMVALCAAFVEGHWVYGLMAIAAFFVGLAIYDKLHGYHFSDEGYRKELKG